MQTVYDWTTVLIFAGLLTHFLSQSVDVKKSTIILQHYLVAATGCAVGNWLGNDGWPVPAVVVIATTLYYIYNFFGFRRGSPPRH